ncbi:MAG TPA: DUF4157 domain-containing protein [Kofleriaceae bacterium]|nr:DUF4157 domain-containing protein [Kofleriaceae bacterium]
MTRDHDERWMRHAERDGSRRAIPFDPVVEGARHGLPRELSLALWKLVREEGATAPEQADLERAELRFHELAAQLAARAAKLRPDAGRLTRVAVELEGVPTARAAIDALRSQVPGRETKVIVEARRWASLEPQRKAATQHDPAAQPAPVVTATMPGLPGAEAVASALAELSLGAPGAHAGDHQDAHPAADSKHTEPANGRALASAGHDTGHAEAPQDRSTDGDEREADEIAERVVSRKNHVQVPRPTRRTLVDLIAGSARADMRAVPSPDHLQTPMLATFLAPAALRSPAATLHRSGEAPVDDAAAHGPTIAAALARRGAGDALPATLRRDMEAVLRADLSRVRIHTDAVAGTAARTIRARAFTIGADIFFAPGAFEPESEAGRELLAHELTHVVQAQEGRVASGGGGGLRISDPDEAAEREAEQVAHRARSAPRRDLAQSALAFVATAFAPAPAFAHGMAAFRTPATGGGANAVVVPDGGKPVNEIGLVARDQEPQLRMRSSMSTANDSNILATLPFNTRVQVMQAFPGDWLLVATADGRLGYCARQYVWYAPEHKLPEPNAKLHKVEGGTAGFAISIAQHYYGDIANKWGTDLRFFVNVLGAVNHQDVPDTTSGWKTVQFKAGTYIWIPSADFAKSLHGVLNSGSRTYNLASALGIAGFLERVGQLYTDFKDAIALSGKYLPRALAKHAEDSILGILQSLMWMAIGAVALLAVTTAVGAAIGALAGGVGAAPGAAAGFEVGLALLDWIGLAFLVKWIGSAVVRIGSTFGTFFGAVWNARGDKGAIDAAARAFAEAIGTLVGVLLEALVMWAISAGVKKAVPKIAETPIGRAFGNTKLGEWLDARIKSYKAGEAPILGPKQALRKLLELRRRGERGEEGEKPPKTGDAYDKLAEKHSLDDVVTQILREQQIDPALVERLLAKKMDPFDIAEAVLDFGGEGLRAIETMVKANVQPRAALAVLSMARDMGIGEQVIALVNSGKLENLQGLKKFMTEISQELSQMDPAPGNWHTGKFNELMEAYRRAVEQGHDVSVGGNAAAKGGKPAGKADVVDYTTKQALQSKTVTSPKLENVVENLQKAVDQLNGEHGELPPDGYQRIADIIIENPKNELFQASREQIAAALKGKVHGLEKLSPKDTTPGVVRVKNAISTFLFQPSELR